MFCKLGQLGTKAESPGHCLCLHRGCSIRTPIQQALNPKTQAAASKCGWHKRFYRNGDDTSGERQPRNMGCRTRGALAKSCHFLTARSETRTTPFGLWGVGSAEGAGKNLTKKRPGHPGRGSVAEGAPPDAPQTPDTPKEPAPQGPSSEGGAPLPPTYRAGVAPESRPPWGRNGPGSHPCRRPAGRASPAGCCPPSPRARPSAPSRRRAARARAGRAARVGRGRPRGGRPGTGAPSPRPRRGAGPGAAARRPGAQKRARRRGARCPRPPPRGASTRLPPTAPGWWRRPRGRGASAPARASDVRAEPAPARPGTAGTRAPGRRPRGGPCQEPRRPRGGRPGPGRGASGTGRRTRGVGALRGGEGAPPAALRRERRSATALTSRPPRQRQGARAERAAGTGSWGRGLQRVPARGGGACCWDGLLGEGAFEEAGL